MRTLNIVFTDKEFKKLLFAKKNYKETDRSWHKFVLEMLVTYSKLMKGGVNGKNKD